MGEQEGISDRNVMGRHGTSWDVMGWEMKFVTEEEVPSPRE